MNKYRREELLDAVSLLDESIERIEEIKFEEEDCFDSLPEGLQYSITGQSMQESIDTLEGFIDSIAAISKNITDYAQPPKKRKKK